MRVIATAAVLGLVMLAPWTPTAPTPDVPAPETPAVSTLTPPVEVPPAVRSALLPGSEIYEEAIKRHTRLSTGNIATTPDVTFSEPKRTNYLTLEPQAKGPITYAELTEVPQRYEFYQYIEGQPRALYTVDVTGDFWVVEDPDYKVAQKLLSLPEDGSHVTTWPYYDFWVPTDGSTVYALDYTAEDFLGASSVDSDTFRNLDAAKVLAAEAEHKELLAQQSVVEKAQRNPVLLAVALMVCAAGLAVLFFPRSRTLRGASS